MKPGREKWEAQGWTLLVKHIMMRHGSVHLKSWWGAEFIAIFRGADTYFRSMKAGPQAEKY